MTLYGTKFNWPERLFVYSDRSAGPDGCWPWLASKTRKGYGNCIGPDGEHGAAHRLVYEYEVGPIPEGLQLDHLCRNRACVNPAHLEPVDNDENRRRARYSEIGVCRKGHDVSGPGALIPAGKNKMRCKACRTAYVAEWKARRDRAA